MSVFCENEKKILAFLACAVMVSVAMVCVLAGDVYADGEEEGPVAVDDETFEYEGLVYKITDSTETEEKVGLSGVAEGYIGTEFTVPSNFTYSPDEETEITYTVTSVMAGAFEGKVVTSLLLPTTIVSIEAGAISSATSLPASVTFPGILSDDGKTVTVPYSGDEVALVDYLGDSTVTGSFIDASAAVVLTCEINVTGSGELKATNIADFPDGNYTVDVYPGVVNRLPGCEYSRDYFSCTGWAFSADGESEIDDGSDLVVGEDVTADTTLYAVWEEDSCFEDYPESYMYITCAIIVILAVVGITMAAYRHIQKTR